MKMIPSAVLEEAGVSVPGGERELFEKLKHCSLTPYDVVLHSLNMTEDDEKRWGETDFVLVSQWGILVIEVKGGPVSCKGGYWSYKGKEKTAQPPAAQAKDNYFALENYLKEQFPGYWEKCVHGWACIFPHIPYLVEARHLEQGDEITAYDEDVVNEKSIEDFLTRVFRHWAKKAVNQNPKKLTPAEVAEICAFLRPDFERAPSLNSHLRVARAQMQKLTEEQYRLIDFAGTLDRLMVDGPAGTGKSFLAIYQARLRNAENKAVIFVTRNPSFASFVSAELASVGIEVATIAELESGIGSRTIKADTLILDEAQDLCRWEVIDTLDRCLEGGLEGGQWSWFGDSDWQVSSSVKFDEDVYQYYLKCAEHRGEVRQNVRNAPKIVEGLERYTGADFGSKYAKGVGEQMRIGEGADRNRALREVGNKLERLFAGGAEDGDIAILVVEEEMLRRAVDLVGSIGREAAIVDEARFDFSCDQKTILVSTIECFKGLERPIVFVVGLWALARTEDLRDLKAMLYRSISRANHTVFIAAEKSLRAAMLSLGLDGHERLGSSPPSKGGR